MKIEKSREQQWGLLDRLSTLYLTETCSSTTQPKPFRKLDALSLGVRRWVWRVAFLIYLKTADNRSDGRTCGSFASTVSWPTLCELRGAFAYGRLSLDVCFTSSERLFSKWWETVTLIYPNIVCPALNGWWTNSGRSAGRHASVNLQREGSGHHLSHQMQPANEKHPNSGILHSDHRSGCIQQIFGHYTEEKVHTQTVWEHVRSLQKLHLLFETLLNSDAWKQFFVPCPTMCPTVLLYAGTAEGGAGIDQWANVCGRAGRSSVSRSPPLPFHSSMRPLFTCKMWFSPPCSSHTLKTGTPCYDPALPANIK